MKIKDEDLSIQMDVNDLRQRKEVLKSRLIGPEEAPTFNHSKLRKECHWDFVLKEVCWLAEDFQRERSRHINNAKKVVKATEVYCKTADQRKIKKSKDEVLALKRVAGRISRDVRKYWLKINQLIAMRQKLESDSIRQKAMDKHLEYLVKQTEAYAKQVSKAQADDDEDDSSSEEGESRADSRDVGQEMDEDQADDQDSRSHTEQTTDVTGSPENGMDSDDSFSAEEEEDDETTLLEQEAQESGGHEQEVMELQDDANLSLEELAAKYGYNANNGKYQLDYESEQEGEEQEEEEQERQEHEDQEEDGMYVAGSDEDASFSGEEEEDDETTLLEQEAVEAEQGDAGQEVKELQDEANMSIEELAAKYGYNGSNGKYQLDYESDQEEQEPEQEEELADEDDGEEDEEAGSDDDASFTAEDEQDDETTLLEQEALEAAEQDGSNELAGLQDDANLSLEALAAKYGYSGHRGAFTLPDDDEESKGEGMDEEAEDTEESSASTPVQKKRNRQGHVRFIERSSQDTEAADDSDDSFSAEEEEDDETTLLEQEAQESGGHEQEVMELQDDANLSLEELAAKYGYNANNGKYQLDYESDQEGEEMDEDQEQDQEEHDGAMVVSNADRLEALDATARTLRIPLPFILKANLRDYQHIGMSWLISLHDRRLNGILADEMGLGKTIQTIAMLAYLAIYKGIWGPHLIIVPTSCLINWECELKRFAPAFKILTYYGTAKQRKALRVGWSRLNSFHVCITSYQIVLADQGVFKRKHWYYMILDEAHHIKNYLSKKWQALLLFNTSHRLLLSGTPLQNNILELWSLLHFLMPLLFTSRKEFAYWFNDPLNKMIDNTSMVTGSTDIVSRLHTIIRPFILRRLKSEVATQLPNKYEYILTATMSKRQLYLYEEFINANPMTGGGGYISMMNILMQLRKICNHPDLVEPRLIHTPYIFEGFGYFTHKRVFSLVPDPVDLFTVHMPIWVDDVHYDALTAAVRGIKGVQQQKQKHYLQALLHPRGGANPSSYQVFPRMQRYQPARCLQILRHPDLQNPRFWQRRTSLSTSLQDVLYAQREEVLRRCKIVVPKVLAPPIRCTSSGVRQTQGTSSEVQRFIRTVLAQRTVLLFPDKKLIQYDCGKLMLLARLLQQIKTGSGTSPGSGTKGTKDSRRPSKVLIFTQMSRMLDILEVFLNLNHHSFLRLDGSTPIEQRQRLMDQFNQDDKVFVFILSTRSGGLGINLTGANHVIFYDTDWNPAMDAQAQDRAHRIGQTRDVHIYRLLTAASIEENILKKSKQKKQLDVMVMSGLDTSSGAQRSVPDPGSVPEAGVSDTTSVVLSAYAQVLAAGQLTALHALEESDDAMMRCRASEEAAEEEKEFVEGGAPGPTEADAEADGEGDGEDGEEGAGPASGTAGPGSGTGTTVTTTSVVNDEEAAASEMSALLSAHGNSFEQLTAHLQPIDRYAMHYRSSVDVFVSQYALSFAARTAEVVQGIVPEGDGTTEEVRAGAPQEVICAGRQRVRRVKDMAKRYAMARRQKARERKAAQLMGVDWALLHTPSGVAYYLNSTTKEVAYTMPAVLRHAEEHTSAVAHGWSKLPLVPLLCVLAYLQRTPYRAQATQACYTWYSAHHHPSFAISVPSVERHSSAALLQEHLQTAGRGEKLLLCAGHHWLRGNVTIDRSLCLQGEGECVVETEGLSIAQGVCVVMIGITLRCTTRSSTSEEVSSSAATAATAAGVLTVHGKLMASDVEVVLPPASSSSSRAAHALVITGSAYLQDCVLHGSIQLAREAAGAYLHDCMVEDFARYAVDTSSSTSSVVALRDCTLAAACEGLVAPPHTAGTSSVVLMRCDLSQLQCTSSGVDGAQLVDCTLPATWHPVGSAVERRMGENEG